MLSSIYDTSCYQSNLSAYGIASVYPFNNPSFLSFPNLNYSTFSLTLYNDSSVHTICIRYNLTVQCQYTCIIDLLLSFSRIDHGGSCVGTLSTHAWGTDDGDFIWCASLVTSGILHRTTKLNKRSAPAVPTSSPTVVLNRRVDA